MMVALPSFNENNGAPSIEPRVFVRAISARPGAPWDQTRQATLEARLGAPSKLSDVIFRLRRLERWRPGREARFAAVYVLAADARKGLVANTSIDGRPLVVSFAAPAEQARRLRFLGMIALASAAATFLIVAVAGTLLQRRAEASERLAAVEQLAGLKLRQAEELQRMSAQTLMLDAQGLRQRRMQSVLDQIAWASRAKAPSAHVWALHWDHGFVAVESGGEAAPLQDPRRPLQRSRAPVRPGVWLWGVETQPFEGAQ